MRHHVSMKSVQMKHYLCAASCAFPSSSPCRVMSTGTSTLQHVYMHMHVISCILKSTAAVVLFERRQLWQRQVVHCNDEE